MLVRCLRPLKVQRSGKQEETSKHLAPNPSTQPTVVSLRLLLLFWLLLLLGAWRTICCCP